MGEPIQIPALSDFAASPPVLGMSNLAIIFTGEVNRNLDLLRDLWAHSLGRYFSLWDFILIPDA